MHRPIKPSKCFQAAFQRTYSLIPRIRATPSRETPGQFGLKGLHQPTDWQRIANSCVEDCLHYADRIRTHPFQPNASVLQLFDDLSDRLCSVLDVAELCRNVHPDPEFANAAHDAFVDVSSVVQHLNADRSLYEPLSVLYHEDREARKAAGSKGFLSHEEVVMMKSLKHDFDRGGITLSDGEKGKLLHLQNQVASLGEQFVSPPENGPPVLELSESKLRHLPANVRTRFSPSDKPLHVRAQLDGPTSHLLLKWIPDSRTREQVYRLTHDHDADSKLKVLGSLFQSRFEVARLLGHRSYADLLFSDRLASSTDEVVLFLEQLSRTVLQNANAERNEIEVEKLRREPQTAANDKPRVHGWDRSFYIGRLKAQSFDLTSAELSNYLSLSACLQGLSEIVDNIFGVKLIKVKANADEIWHEDVEKVQLVDDSGEILGHIFLDLYPRPRKYGHAAHFSIRCGREPSGANEYQTPVVALVCNFGRSSPGGHRLLSVSEYETLFHEFGHSLHSILSRTKYQHLSGTRVATDFVEIPSHLFEHFAWDPRVISRFARHHQTGEPIPTRILKSMCASRNGFIATDVQMQLLFSVMDLQFHGSHPPSKELVGTFQQLQQKLTSYTPDDGVPVPATFHHFVGYGAGYYSYIFARVISAHLWSSLFAENPMSRAGGLNFRYNILAHGGAKDPCSMLQTALQGPVSCDPFLRSVGIEPDGKQFRLRLPVVANSR